MKTLRLLLIFCSLFMLYDHAGRAQHWIRTNLDTMLVVSSLTPDGNGTIYATSIYDGAYKSSDRGNNWSFLGLVSTGDIKLMLLSSFVNASNHLFVGSSAGIYRSTNGGGNWTLLSPQTPLPAIEDFSYGSGGAILACNYEGVHRTTNNGDTWTTVNQGLAYLDVFCLVRNRSNNVFAGTVDGVYKTTNNGTSWSYSGSGITATPVRSILFRPDTYLFAGTDGGGIFRSSNNGANWQEINSGLSGLFVYSLAINAQNQILAGTDMGVYRTTNNGDSWEEVSSGLTNPTVHSLCISGAGSSNGYAFVGTGGYGERGTAGGGGIYRSSQSTLLGSPIQIRPADLATAVAAATEFRWHSLSDASDYQLQVAEDGGFANIVEDVTGLGDTNHTIAPLSFNRTYFWRIRGSNFWTTGSWSTTRSFTTQLEAPTLISPAAGETGVPLPVATSWSPSPGATQYRIQVALDPQFTSVVYDQSGMTGTNRTVPGLGYNTHYFWRIIAGSSNNSSDWSQTGEFTTTLPPPPAPHLLAPLNGASDIPTDPQMSWSPAPTADTYQLQAATDAGFINLVVDQADLIPTVHNLTGLAHGTRHYWRVRGNNVAGPGSWSEVWNFKTIPLPPAAPLLLSPGNGSAEIDTSPLLSWNPSAGALLYRLQISTSADFSSLIVDMPNLSTVSHQATGLNRGIIHYWRVNAANSGGTSEWSEIWHFTTAAQLAAPVLQTPPNNASSIPMQPTFGWLGSTGADTYRLQVSTESGFGTLLFDQEGITGTAITPASLTLINSMLYYWRVNARRASGTSPWSETWSFTTIIAAPDAPILISPSNGEQGTVRNPTLRWNGSARAQWYRAQLALNPQFNPTILDDSIQGTSRQAANLQNGTTFHWRVGAGNDGGTTWSAIWSFTTGSGTPVERSGDNIPERFGVEPAYPNPCNDEAIIPVRVPAAGHVCIRIFDLLGRDVGTVTEEVPSPGTHLFRLAVSRLTPGVYIVLGQIATQSSFQKFTVRR